MKKNLRNVWMVSSIAPVVTGAMLLSSHAYAQNNQANQEIEEVVTIGTRAPGRTALESLVPVDVISEAAIRNSGAVDTADMLRKLAPSFNMNNTTTSDGQDLMRPATLRSMAPDQVLVLVNGKRRHQQAMVAVQENVGRGSAGTDLSSIPLTAIARVEILRDGAAAQYGSDAIAGVINIILKEAEGGSAWAQYRTTDENDGDTTKVGLNYGMEIGDGGSLNFTFEQVDQDSLNRASKTNWFGASPVTDQLILVGEGEVESSSFWVNSTLPVGNGELYVFGGMTKKEGESLGFYRGPGDGRVWSELFPQGVTPGLGTESQDTSLVVGFRTELGDWDTDFSVNWGENEFEFSNTNSLNASYGAASPTKAYDGSLTVDQLAFNVDAVRSISLSFAEDATLAIGAEWREEGYKQEAGDEVSYARGDVLCDENFENSTDPAKDPATCIYDGTNGTTVPGMQGFQGYSPAMELDTDRDSYAVYADVEMALSDSFDIGIATRYEDYSDFGDTANAKVSGRYAFTEELAVRGAISTGFRAPGVQQQNFTQRSISLDNGVLADLVTLRPDSDLANDFGFSDLTEETSTSYSIGLTFNRGNWVTTLDIYRIDIDDRIAYSDNISRGISAEIDALFDANSGSGQLLDGVANVSIFTNAIDTETTGLDWVNEWDYEISNGSLVLEASLHLNDTDVSGVNSSSNLVGADVIYGSSAELLLTEGQPGEKGVFAATYSVDDWSVTARANYYGEVSSASYGSQEKTWGAKTLFDLTAYWDINERFRVSGGVLNVFDTYPDKWGSEGGDFPELGFQYGWTTFPFSIAGREFYVRASVNF
ncbi:MAG: TonB-dependent receptor [Oceanicoccus sp.]